MSLQTELKAAKEFFDSNAVQFESNWRYNDQKAWPFWFPFVPSPYLDTDSQNGGLGLLGLTIPAGTTKDIFITTERDTVFRMLHAKYTAFEDTGGGVYRWWDGVLPNTVAGSISYSGGAIVPAIPLPQMEYIYRPLTHYLKVSLDIPSLGSRILMGGNQHITSGGLANRGVRVRSIQGINDGMGVLRVPALVPLESTIRINIENTYSADLVVNGSLFGYKVALSEIGE
jgi:hypothetical protein